MCVEKVCNRLCKGVLEGLSIVRGKQKLKEVLDIKRRSMDRL